MTSACLTWERVNEVKKEISRCWYSRVLLIAMRYHAVRPGCASRLHCRRNALKEWLYLAAFTILFPVRFLLFTKAFKGYYSFPIFVALGFLFSRGFSFSMGLMKIFNLFIPLPLLFPTAFHVFYTHGFCSFGGFTLLCAFERAKSGFLPHSI